MTLKDRITEDMKTTMRARDAERLLAIRGLLAAIKQREVDERVVLDDAAVVARSSTDWSSSARTRSRSSSPAAGATWSPGSRPNPGARRLPAAAPGAQRSLPPCRRYCRSRGQPRPAPQAQATWGVDGRRQGKIRRPGGHGVVSAAVKQTLANAALGQEVLAHV